jgi:hypothetical protein
MLNYTTIANTMKDETIAYISSISSIVEEGVKRFNSDFIAHILSTVNNSVGVYATNSNNEFLLLGIPTSYQNNLTSLINEIIKKIKNGNDLFVSKIKKEFKENQEVEAEVISNYTSYVQSEFDKLIIDVNAIVNSIIKAQENYQRVVSKLLFVTSRYQNAEGYDGYQDKEGNIVSYKLTTEPKKIIDLISSANNAIRDILQSINKKVTPNKLIPTNEQKSLIYFLFYGILKNKENLTDFKNKIILKSLSKSNIEYNNTIKILFDEYWNDVISTDFTPRLDIESIYSKTIIDQKTKSNDTIKTIGVNEDEFKFPYLVIENPDDNIKDALLNLNSKLDYDSTNNKTWNKNKNNFILVKNKLSK